MNLSIYAGFYTDIFLFSFAAEQGDEVVMFFLHFYSKNNWPEPRLGYRLFILKAGFLIGRKLRGFSIYGHIMYR
jgi:hypothetical protein